MADADKAVLLWLNGFVGRSSAFDEIIGWLASDYLIPVSLSLTLVAMWFIGQNKEVRLKYQLTIFVALTAMALSSLAVFIINAFYFRPRPFDSFDSLTLLFYKPTDSSFPANSAAATFAIAAAVWSINRPIGTAMFVAAGLYGFARVFAGVHYPLDIIAGALIALAVVFLVILMRKLLMPILVAVIKAARILCLA